MISLRYIKPALKEPVFFILPLFALEEEHLENTRYRSGWLYWISSL